MATQTTPQELSTEQKQLVLKAVSDAIEAEHDDIKQMLDEPVYTLFNQDEHHGGHSPAIYGLFMQSLLLLMTVPENSAFMQKNFGRETLDCFDKLLFFFKYMGDEPVEEWVDYTRCNRFRGGLNSNEIELLRKKYLKGKS